MATALLAACSSSVILPPWTPGAPTGTAARPVTSPPSARPDTIPTQPAPASGGVQTFPVQTFPAPAQGVQVTPVTPVTPNAPSPTVQALPYGPAVAARFPAPSVVYNTPGLQPGRTAYTTGAEMRSYLRDQAIAASRTPGVQAAVIPIGTSRAGEQIEALVLARSGAIDPAALQANGRPTVVMFGQQQGDEPASAEALLVLSRELAQGLLVPMLERINVVIVPRANPDAAAAGMASAGGGANMDRDHLLLDTPEAQALARLARDYRATVVVDAQEYTVDGGFQQKFGAVQKPDAQLQYATVANHPEFLTKADEEWFRRPLLAALRAQGLSSEWHYTASADPADRKLTMGGTSPATSRNAYGLKNAVSLLVESRGAGIGRSDLQRRVHTQVTALSSVLSSTAQRAAELNQLRPYLEREAGAGACRDEAVLNAAPTSAQYELGVLDQTTGADRKIIVDWDSSLALRSVRTRIRPCGYWVSTNAAAAVERLRLHGVQVMRVAETGTVLGDSYRETGRAPGASPAQAVVQTALVRGVIDVSRGSFYIPMNQPLANLVMAALEPDATESFYSARLVDRLQDSARIMSEPALKMDPVQ
ncbi:MAG: peptidase M14 [Comamonadaceae bacterium]|nr:MAG: peptidase M14 [Comamonadaceae bacterium]